MPAIEILRRVRFDNEELDAVRMMIRTDRDLELGAQIEVELGARYHTEGTGGERVRGVWVPCVVISDNNRELVVRLL